MARRRLQVRLGSEVADAPSARPMSWSLVGPYGWVPGCTPETHGLAIGKADFDIVGTRVVGNVVSRVPYVCALAQGRVHSSFPWVLAGTCGPIDGFVSGPLEKVGSSHRILPGAMAWILLAVFVPLLRLYAYDAY